MRFAPLLLIMLMIGSAGVIPAGGPPSKPTINPIVCQIWHNVPGAQINDTLNTDDLNRKPDETRSMNTLEFLPGFKDSYACSLSGLITVPTTGAYWFRVASRDSGILFLSTDESPAHRRYVAETPASTDIHQYRFYSAQTSDGIRLVAGQKYFIQAIFKSGPGPGGISIGWQMTNGISQGPIPSDRFSPSNEVPPAPPNLRVKHVSVLLTPEVAPTTQPGLQAGIQKYVRGAQFEVDGKTEDLSYLMDLPANYGSTTDAKPMLVFLHGNNRQGYTLDGMMQTGPIHDLLVNPQLRNWLPMIVLCPQLPPDWRWDTPGAAQVVNGLVHQLCQRNPRIDPKRIYITGLSMGGRGTWLTAEDSPQTYAAVVPISAVDVRPDLAPELFKDLPELHIVCGSEDGGFTAGSHRMFEALQPALGDRVQLTVFPHEGHSVWDHLYGTQSFYEELMKFSR